MATLYEYYTDHNTAFGINSSIIVCGQTFTPQITHTAYSLMLLLYTSASGTGGTLKVSLQATTGGVGSEEPVAPDLCSKSLDCSGISQDSGNPEWVEFVFTTTPTLTSGIVYAWRVARTSGTKSFGLKQDSTSPTYTRGHHCSGVYVGGNDIWSVYTTRDQVFKEYGESVFAPPTDIVTYKRLVAAAADTIWYEDI